MARTAAADETNRRRIGTNGKHQMNADSHLLTGRNRGPGDIASPKTTICPQMLINLSTQCFIF